jgi:hypothetical protein
MPAETDRRSRQTNGAKLEGMNVFLKGKQYHRMNAGRGSGQKFIRPALVVTKGPAGDIQQPNRQLIIRRISDKRQRAVDLHYLNKGTADFRPHRHGTGVLTGQFGWCNNPRLRLHSEMKTLHL